MAEKLEMAKKDISNLHKEMHATCVSALQSRGASPSSPSSLFTTTPISSPPTEESHCRAVSSMRETRFFRSLRAADSSRHYMIIVDKSASMKLGGRWKQAEEAVKIIADQACSVDTNG